MAILEIKNLTKNFGHVAALENVSLSIREKEITSIIGPNGAGKTTFYNVLTGKFPPTSGTVLFKGKDITALPPYKVWKMGISRSFQITNIFKTLTVLENIRSALIVHQGKNLKFFKPIDRFDDLYERKHADPEAHRAGKAEGHALPGHIARRHADCGNRDCSGQRAGTGLSGRAHRRA